MSYRRRYNGPLNVTNMLALTLFDAKNPRSMLYQLNHIADSVAQLPKEQLSNSLNEELKPIIEAQSLLKLSNIQTLNKVDETTGMRTDLDQLCAHLQTLLTSASDILSREYFYQTQNSHQLTDINWEGE